MKEINLPIYGIKVTLENLGETEQLSGTIISTDLRCVVRKDDATDELFNSAMNGIESLILACACSGIDIEDERFIEAIQTSVEAVANNI